MRRNGPVGSLRSTADVRRFGGNQRGSRVDAHARFQGHFEGEGGFHRGFPQADRVRRHGDGTSQLQGGRFGVHAPASR